jgi:hypothetical protein
MDTFYWVKKSWTPTATFYLDAEVMYYPLGHALLDTTVHVEMTTG